MRPGEEMTGERLIPAWLRPRSATGPVAAAWPKLLGRERAAEQAPATVEPPPGQPVACRFSEADLARACAAVASRERAAERAALLAEREAMATAALAAIAGRLAEVDGMLALQRRRFREAAAALAGLVAEAIAPADDAGIAARLAEALADDCLARLDPEQALVIEVAPAIAGILAARIETIPALAGRSGRIAVEPVAALPPGEARVVWAHGHGEWSIDSIRQTAMRLVPRLLAEEAGETPDAMMIPSFNPKSETQ